MANKNNLKVERAPFEYNGKSYFDHLRQYPRYGRKD